MGGQFADWVNSLDTIWTKLDLGRKELNTLVLVKGAVNEGWLNNTGLAASSLEQALGKPSTGHGHRKGGRASAVLGLDDLVTTELDAVDQGVELVTSNLRMARLGDQGNDGDARVTANNSDVLISWVGAGERGDEARSSDNVKSGDTKQTLRVVDALALEDLGANWYCGVHLDTSSEHYMRAERWTCVRGWR